MVKRFVERASSQPFLYIRATDSAATRSAAAFLAVYRARQLGTLNLTSVAGTSTLTTPYSIYTTVVVHGPYFCWLHVHEVSQSLTVLVLKAILKHLRSCYGSCKLKFTEVSSKPSVRTAYRSRSLIFILSSVPLEWQVCIGFNWADDSKFNLTCFLILNWNWMVKVAREWKWTGVTYVKNWTGRGWIHASGSWFKRRDDAYRTER